MGWKHKTVVRSRSPMTVDSSIPPPTDFTFDIEVIDIYTLDTSVAIPCSSEDLPINALVTSGYLGNTPIRPTLAISLRTLELFGYIRSRKSSFSVEAFTKVVCDLYSVFFPLRIDPGRRLTSTRFHTAGDIVLHSPTHLRHTLQFCEGLRCSSMLNFSAILLIGG
jgi:hypothetical protein